MPRKVPRKTVEDESYEKTAVIGRNLKDFAEELRISLASLYLNPKYSDLKILCGSETFLAHRCIVCPRSGFFAGACNSEFQEASSGTILLHDEQPALIKKMLEFLYTLEYTVGVEGCISEGSGEEKVSVEAANGEAIIPEATVETTLTTNLSASSLGESSKSPIHTVETYDPLSFHVLMYSLADRLLIDGLKAASKIYFYDRLMERLDSQSFPLAVLEVYRSTPQHDRGLRDLIIKVTMRHLMILRDPQEPDTGALQNDLLQQVPDFAYDLSVAMMDKCVTNWKQLGYCRTEWRQ